MGRSGTAALHAFIEALRSLLPQEWSIRVQRAVESLDAVIDLAAPDGTHARILVEAKNSVEPRQVPMISSRLRRLRQALTSHDRELVAVLVSSYTSPRTRDVLAQEDMGWYDLTGNLRLRINRPAVFLDRRGADQNPDAGSRDRRLRSLRGPGAARIVRALLDGRARTGVRALAAESGVGVGTSSRVLDLLTRDHLVERAPDGAVTAIRKGSLVRHWARDYGLTTSNQAVPVLAPRGLSRTLEDLRGYPQRNMLGAGAAARLYLPEEEAAVTPLSLLVVYVDDAVEAQRQLGLRQTDRGANTLLVEPFDEVIYHGGMKHEGLLHTAPSQTVADLLTGPGRSPEEAQQLLSVLSASDLEWTQ